MMRKSFWIISILVFSLAVVGNLRSEPIGPAEEVDRGLSIMRPDVETRLKWIEEYERAQRAAIDEEIEFRLSSAKAMQVGTSLSLLNHLEYVASEREQGACGNCWNWTGTGIMEIALSVQGVAKDRLSTQFVNSCKTDWFACCGGTLGEFVNWYSETGLAIPWSNTNAFFQDGSTGCEDHGSPLPCGSIGTVPSYPVSTIQSQRIETTGVGQSQAIANVKNILNQGRGVWLDFWLANQADWDDFFDFWRNQPESALWNPDDYCGRVYEKDGGGHAVLVVGYNDDDPDTANHYWTVLNSWGTARGNRPNGLFRIPMHMNYDCTYTEGSFVKRDSSSRNFMTLNLSFHSSAGDKPNLTPYKPQGWSDKIVVSKAIGTVMDSKPILATDALYVSWAVLNDSISVPSSPFSVALYVDGAFRTSWDVDPLSGDDYTSFMDYPVGALNAGMHRIKIVADSAGVIDESNEADNDYTKTITVGTTTGPDLTGAWISARESCRSAFGGDSCRIKGSFEVSNIGNRDALSSFSVRFYLRDDTGDILLKEIVVRPLKTSASKGMKLNLKLPSGERGSGKRIMAVIDPHAAVSEKNEANNSVVFGPLP